MNPKALIHGLRLLPHLSLPLMAGFLLCLPFGIAQALPTDKSQGMKVSSNSASIDEKKGITTLTGAVKLVQGTLEINAEKITLQYDKNKKLQSLVAEGAPARYQQQPELEKAIIHAEANGITYNLSKNFITLDKNAFVEQQGATTRGGRINYDIAKGTISASGSGTKTDRVEFVIPPQTDKKE